MVNYISERNIFEMFEQLIAHAYIWRKDIDGFIAENGYS